MLLAKFVKEKETKLKVIFGSILIKKLGEIEK